MPKLNVAVVVGSNRRNSINRRYAEALVRLAADRMGARFVRIDDLPMYNADLEASRPPAVDRFTAELAEADAVLVVMPEHNRSLPAVLKNAIDWASKPAERNIWKGKVVAITGTSPGAIGTAVGQQHLRQILGILGSLVVGGEAYISFKPDLIGPKGEVANESTRVFLRGYLDTFLSSAEKLAGTRERDRNREPDAA